MLTFSAHRPIAELPRTEFGSASASARRADAPLPAGVKVRMAGMQELPCSPSLFSRRGLQGDDGGSAAATHAARICELMKGAQRCDGWDELTPSQDMGYGVPAVKQTPKGTPKKSPQGVPASTPKNPAAPPAPGGGWDEHSPDQARGYGMNAVNQTSKRTSTKAP